MYLITLFTHIFFTLISMILGYYLFLFSKKTLNLQISTTFVLCFSLVISAITGIMLNTTTFSPFHILAIVTLTTTPLALVNLYRKNYLDFKRGIFFNFLGLNLAFVGALEPDRYLGSKLWNPIQLALGWDSFVVGHIWFGILILSVLYVIFLVYRVLQNPTFFV
jgi:hypothetical protein